MDMRTVVDDLTENVIAIIHLEETADSKNSIEMYNDAV